MGARGFLAWLLSAVFSVGGATVPASGPTRPELPFVTRNVELLQNIPDAGGISASFDPNRPYMYMSTAHGMSVYEISKPEWPTFVSTLPMAFFQNEAVNLGPAGFRKDGTSFVLMGTDLGGALTPTDVSRTAVEPGGGGYVQHVYVIDVTDPKRPFIRSDISPTTYTHTVSCVTKGCEYAYTAGTNEEFSIIDLRDLDHPKEIKQVKDAWGWHDWDVDASNVLWKSGDGGLVAYDIRDPLNPVALNGTNKDGDSETQTWNTYVMHNSERPYARKLPAGAVSGPGTPSVFNGDVLLVTEEDQRTPQCTNMGRFETWEIPSLRPTDNPGNERAGGTIRPLDRWRAGFLDNATVAQLGAECSAHYFDFHHKGFVAQSWYNYGTRILDVRDAKNIKEVGYFVAHAQATWASYWVPKRARDGRVVVGPEGMPLETNIVYSVDAVRGLDVLRVKLPTTTPAKTTSVAPPELPAWLRSAEVPVADRVSVSFSCRIR